MLRSLLILSALFCTPAAAQSRPDLEFFVREPAMHQPVLSPSGSHIAYFSYTHGRPIVAVVDLATGHAEPIDLSNVRGETIRWASDRYLLVTASAVRGVQGIRGQVDVSAALAFDLENDLSSIRLLRRADDVGRNVALGRILGINWETNGVLIPAWDRDGNYSLFEANPANGRGRLIERGSSFTNGWFVGPDGLAAARLDYNNDTNQQRFLVYEDGRVTEQSREGNLARISFNGVGYMQDGRFAVSTLYRSENSRRGLYGISQDTAEIDSQVFEHNRFDLDRPRIDPYTNLVVGADFVGDAYLETFWFDTELAEVQLNIANQLAGAAQSVYIESWNRQRNRFVLRLEADASPPAYILYDRDSAEFVMIGQSHPELAAAGALNNRSLIEFTARDGTSIPAFVTVPFGQGPFPAVILPHGGPASRDIGGFDPLAHFLASRGYLVLQPNFRGSSGYGFDWLSAGYGQWGEGIMQHDLTDGANALIESGLVDEGRLCIVGSSYGGYAALAGATFTPDLFQCAVGVSGVYDLVQMDEWNEDRFGSRHWSQEYWSESITGDTNGRRSRMRAVSPRHYVESIRIPVLLIHGRDDTVVPIQQSQNMRNALRNEDAELTYVDLDSGDHWLTSVETRREVFSQIEQFLATHIGN